MDEFVTLARTVGPRGEVVLRRRGQGDIAVDELIVNGVFAMHSLGNHSERQLARLAFESGPDGGRMLIGGLGLGYTAHEALSLPVGEIVVAEIEPALVDWAHAGLTAIFARLAKEPRVHLVVGDIRDLLAGTAAVAETWDAIALDVDNGPDFLIHSENQTLYQVDFLTSAYLRLAPGGRLAIWCQGPAPELWEVLGQIAPTCRQHVFKESRGGRSFSCAVYTLDRPAI